MWHREDLGKTDASEELVAVPFLPIVITLIRRHISKDDVLHSLRRENPQNLKRNVARCICSLSSWNKITGTCAHEIKLSGLNLGGKLRWP
jgi:hypothetical protein